MRARAKGGPGGVQEGGGFLVGGREEQGGSGGWRTAGTSSLGSSVPGEAARVWCLEIEKRWWQDVFDTVNKIIVTMK